MTAFATCNGIPIASGELLIPLVGAWTADLHLTSGAAMTGAVAVVIGNLTLQGTVYRSSAYGGQTRVRVIGGGGGWRTEITPQGYGSAGAGVNLSIVLADAASACGERVNVPSDTSVGNGYARFGAGAAIPTAASDVLWHAVAHGQIPGWYVDSTGMTQATSWPSTTIATPFTVTHNDPASGLVVVATEDYAAWMPGCTFTSPLLPGPATSSGVHYVWGTDGKFRFEVLTGDQQDAFLGPIQAIVHKELAITRFYGRYEYTISNPSTTTVDGAPVDTSLGLPELQSVPIVSDSISTYTPPNGGTCHIQFLNGDPGKPVCVWTSGPPTMAQILSGSTPVALVGNGVQSFLPPTPVSVTGTLAGSPFTALGVFTVPGPISGTIIDGSPEVSSA